MNAVDLILLAVGGYFVIRGIFRGITGELLSLLSVAGGFFCALRYYKTVSGALTSNLGVTPPLAAALSILGIFALIFLMCGLADRALKKILTGVNLTWADKLGGALAGFIKTYVIAMVLLICGMIAAPITGDAWARDSKALVLTARTWNLAYPLLESIGLSLDVEDIRRGAMDYITRQAAVSISNLSSDVILPLAGASGDISSLAPADGSADLSGARAGSMTEAILDLIQE
jgi:uncharacterized membrane protein required for colicin V production